MNKDSLGERMKVYESIPKARLIPKTPVMVRLDGKAFHTLTKDMPRPYCADFNEYMWMTAKYLCENIQGCQIAYVQSDEITLLLTDYTSIKTQGWFDYEVQKMCSVAASIATAKFNSCLGGNKLACFDARVWNLPKEEVVNCFIWRQQDATRNAIQMLGQSKFSHKELHRKSCDEIQDMLMVKYGINFNDCSTSQKRGVCIVKEWFEVSNNDQKVTMRTKWTIDLNIPIFTQDRLYIQRFVAATLES